MIPLELFAVVLLGVWGCCVGSFLNVVIFRVPEGLSVVSPPSRCPGCETRLAWYDNVPVLGWLWLGGKCRSCKMRISPQYPLIEALVGLLFAGITAAYYFTELRPGFAEAGVAATWPVLGVHLVLIACMVAATMIDAKLFIIPLGITWTAAVVALFLPLSVGLGLLPSDTMNPEASTHWLAPTATGAAGVFADALQGFENLAQQDASLGGVVGLMRGSSLSSPSVVAGMALSCLSGLGVAVLLLWKGVLPLSFADEPELPEGADPNDPDVFIAHPHPRREMLKELLFLSVPVLFAVVGVVVVRLAGWDTAQLPAWLDVLSGVVLGYLLGGALVWGIRILGTVMFGKEAMGLGDVHLMAAVGAVIGGADTTLAFFIAPFFGILVTLVAWVVSSVRKSILRPIPYGPYLCLATLLVMLLRNPIYGFLLPGSGAAP